MHVTNDCGFSGLRRCPLVANPPTNPIDVFEVLQGAGVAEFYPEFRDWFFGRVVPGLRNGERRIFSFVVDGTLAGVAICKRTEAERKLSTLWVRHVSRNRGISAELARNAFAWLESRQPLFTVPEERLDDFRGLVRAWSFPEAVAHSDLYRSGRIEHVFNGPIATDPHSGLLPVSWGLRCRCTRAIHIGS